MIERIVTVVRAAGRLFSILIYYRLYSLR
jgi:hypothetical protein